MPVIGGERLTARLVQGQFPQPIGASEDEPAALLGADVLAGAGEEFAIAADDPRLQPLLLDWYLAPQEDEHRQRAVAGLPFGLRHQHLQGPMPQLSGPARPSSARRSLPAKSS